MHGTRTEAGAWKRQPSLGHLNESFPLGDRGLPKKGSKKSPGWNCPSRFHIRHNALLNHTALHRECFKTDKNSDVFGFSFHCFQVLGLEIYFSLFMKSQWFPKFCRFPMPA